jgi:hypothetical protein
LKVLDRESEVSSLRSAGIVLRKKEKIVRRTIAETECEEADKIEEKDKKRKVELRQTSVDVVMYSPSVRREREIQSLVRDTDLAVRMCAKIVPWLPQNKEHVVPCTAEWKRREDLHVLARAKLIRALALAVAGTHWIISEWCRGYATVSKVADAIVFNSTIIAMETAVPRVVERYSREHVRRLWHIENDRLKVLDETELRRERARLRQEYRKHKKRGRPGRIEMKQSKVDLDVLQLDLEHCTKQKWHPKHSMMRPSIDTPREWERLGLPKPIREKMPKGWIKTTVPYYHKEAEPYYAHVDTGLCHLLNPLSLPDNTRNKRKTETETETTTTPTIKDAQIINIDPSSMQEQHRNYFQEAMTSVDESIAILSSIDSPILHEAFATKSRVAFAASSVAESNGNQATGLTIEAHALINMACDCMGMSMSYARNSGLRYTLEYATLCRRAARQSAYRKHDGDVSDAAERLKEALEIYLLLDLEQRNGVTWLRRQAELELDMLGEFDGYACAVVHAHD